MTRWTDRVTEPPSTCHVLIWFRRSTLVQIACHQHRPLLYTASSMTAVFVDVAPRKWTPQHVAC